MKTNLNINIAKDEYGKDLIIDLSTINHLFVSGTIGSGKSTILHNIISTLISNNSPEFLRLILTDQKQIELGVYDRVPHLLTSVLTEQKKAILAMKWARKEIDRRFNILKENNLRNIDEYYESGSTSETMPPIIIVIDELYDLMSVYPKETESGVARILEMGHIVGIYLIISTSRPSIKVFTKPMRDLISTRIALQITSMQDSKAVIGTVDACMLNGAGHMLYREGMKYIVRGQSTPVEIDEVKKIVNAKIKMYAEEIASELNLSTPEIYNRDGRAIFTASFDASDMDESDELYDEAKKIVVESRKVSTSWLQRKMGIGYSRAAKLVDLLEQNNVIGPENGSKAREVYGEGE